MTAWKRGFRRRLAQGFGVGSVEVCCECGGPMRGCRAWEARELLEVLAEIEWPEGVEGMCPLGACVCGCCGHVKVMLWGRGGAVVWCPGFEVEVHRVGAVLE